MKPYPNCQSPYILRDTTCSNRFTRVGSGIGRACAILLAQEGVSGIVVADLSIDAGNETLALCQTVATNRQFEGHVIQVDVTQEDSVISLFNEAARILRRVDFCVNSAGVSRRLTPIRVLQLTPVA